MARLSRCADTDSLCLVILYGLQRSPKPLWDQVCEVLSKIQGLTVGPVGINRMPKDKHEEPLALIFPSLPERVLGEVEGNIHAILLISINKVPGGA